jgi:hypothetical protein
MNCKIVSAFNEYHLKLHEVSKKSINYFCALSGVSCEFFRIPNDFERPPAWYKIKVILDAIKKYDGYIVWMDADSVIHNNDVSIESYLDKNKFYIVKDFNQINTGFFIVKSCKEIVDFFEKVWSLVEYIDHIWWEQAAIIHLYDNNYLKCQSFTKELDQDIFNSYPIAYYEKGEKAKGCISEKSFTCHFPSLPLDLRLSLMKKYSNVNL